MSEHTIPQSPETAAIATDEFVDGTVLPNTAAADRITQIEQAIDPNHTLPVVELMPDPNKLVGRGSFIPVSMLIVSQDRVIGSATLVSSKRKHSKEAWFAGINIDDGNDRGKGYGIASYLQAIKAALSKGYTFRTHDWSQTGGARRVWEGLKEQGVAEVIEPFVENGQVDSDDKPKYTGHYEVRP